jgi:hypothetical protein
MNRYDDSIKKKRMVAVIMVGSFYLYFLENGLCVFCNIILIKVAAGFK